MNEMKKFRVQVVATTISVADVHVEAISSEDAHAIAITSCKPEDFEVREVVTVNATESIMMDE
jgi:hypothetical protein